MFINRSELIRIGNTIFQTLAETFPVTSASDEFHEFPQVVSPNPEWERWDQFSRESVNRLARQLLAWEDQLTQLQFKTPPSVTVKDSEQRPSNLCIDRDHLLAAVRNLREHLTLVRRWERQPTFYLTIAAIGMAEALLADDPAAPHQRAAGLAPFFDQAAKNLTGVPALFKELGLEMVVDVKHYFQSLARSIPQLASALEALRRFESILHQMAATSPFQLPAQLFARVIRAHMNTTMDLSSVEECLDIEIAATRRLLQRLIARQFESRPLERAYGRIPLPHIPSDGLLSLYRHQVDHLAQFLAAQNIVPTAWIDTCPVAVLPVPGYLSATRTASSYSIAPAYPPRGGTFYVINADDPAEATRGYQREYRILTAHETYPGHHLLDACRWRNENPIRRVIEHPLFYEGWACFAEELMFRLGYLKGNNDLLMLIRRRYWRALRGKIDLGLQTGAMDLETAASILNRAGLPLPQALRVVRKYTLNPGYQICYTVGYQKFRQLFNACGRGQLPRFIQTVLVQGEIHFEDLASLLKTTCSKSSLSF